MHSKKLFFLAWAVHRAKSKGTCAVKIWNQYLWGLLRRPHQTGHTL